MNTLAFIFALFFIPVFRHPLRRGVFSDKDGACSDYLSVDLHPSPYKGTYEKL
jgi:hypothetical protein